MTSSFHRQRQLAKLNQSFLKFSADPQKNINLLVKTCGQLMGARYAVYNCFEDGNISSLGMWNTPSDFVSFEKAEGHISYDLFLNPTNTITLIRNLPKTKYAQTDSTVNKYDLKTYFGHVVKFGKNYSGVLCVVYQEDIIPTKEDRWLMGILASAIAVEEKRSTMQKQLNVNQLRLQFVFQNAKDAILWADVNSGIIINCNKAAVRLFGRSKNELIGMHQSRLHPLATEKNYKKIFKDHCTGRDHFEREMQIITKKGKIKIVQLVSNLRIIDEKPILQGIFCDISERVKVEHDIKQSEANYRAIFNAVNDMIFIHDKYTGAILDVNEKTCRVLGYSRKEIIDLRVEDISKGKYPYTQKEAIKRIRRAMREGPQLFEWVMKTKTGFCFWGEINLKSVVLQGKDRIIAVVRDISVRKEAELTLLQSEEKLKNALEELEDAYEKLKSLDALKSEFLSIVSHELRTPLTSIKSAISLLRLKGERDCVFDDKDKELISIIIKNTDRQTRLISNLLDLSKIEAGVMMMKKERVDLLSLVNDIIANFKLHSDNKNITLQMKCRYQTMKVYCDSDQICRVFNNLIDNAIKFTSEGGKVVVAIEIENAYVKVTIKDNGIGIPKNEIAKLFDKFYMVKRPCLRKLSGTGLGLVIAKKIVESHSGVISVESTLKKGSTFTFTLLRNKEK